MTSPDDPSEAETLAPGVLTPGTSSPRLGGRLGAPPLFAPGALLAERFRIVRFIAQGGMGEVYEAEDLELRDHVALKTISQAVADNEGTMGRFRREVQLSRRVTHANVCRVFDIFRHRANDPSRPGGETAFLTMELLSGETLAERLDRVHRLAPADALPIVAQIAAGLSAAHRAGVIHRDFKAGNVLLVEDPAEPGATRAVVTDFGLAHARALESEGAPSLTASGFVAGTPAYMAPEQIEGGEITPATDLYALGIVMYEMVTGTRPFTGHTPLSIAVSRLKAAPRPPITHVPDLDPKWNAAILRCLERDPADRFASASDLVPALAGELVTPSRGRAQAGRRRRRWILAAASLALLLAAAAGYRLIQRRATTAAVPPASDSPPVPAARSRRSVAVLGFKNLTARPESDWLSAAFSEMLTTELSAGEKLRAISGENVARAKLELAISDAETLAADTLARLRRNLGTDYVVLGSYASLANPAGGQLRLDLRVQDTVSGELLASLSETGTEASFLDLVTRTGARLREKLGAGELSAAEAGGARASLPSSPEAARLYAEGLARLRVYDAIGASDLLEKAVAADPGYPLAHAGLAGAWAALGYDGKAREQARLAFDLSGNLSREDRLAVEGRYRETVREWDRAVEIYRTLWGFFPDNLEYGLRLAASQISAGKRKEALATAESLGRLPAPASEDPRIDLARAQASGSLSDYKSGQAAAESAHRKAVAAGARVLAAEARVLQGDAAASLGDPKRAVALYEESRQAFAAAGNFSRAAWALERVGITAYRQGDFRRARTLAEESLAIYRRSGNEAGVAQALNDQANIAADEGDLAEAKRIYEQVLELQRRLGNLRHVAGSLGNIANLLQYQGDMAGSLNKHQEALPILRQVGEKGSVAVELNNTAIVLAAQGDLAGARRMFEEALAIKKETGNRSSMAYTLRDLGQLLEAQGDLAGARKLLEESVAIREELGQKGRAAEARTALSALAYEEGQPAQAAALARRSVEALDKEDSDSRAEALAVLAQALAAQGEREEAQRAIELAAPLSARSEIRGVRFTVALAAGRVHAAAARFTDAAKSFRSAQDEARRGGMSGAVLEARLALAENDRRSGRVFDARNSIGALESEARAKGFLLIAAKAARVK